MNIKGMYFIINIIWKPTNVARNLRIKIQHNVPTISVSLTKTIN